MPRNTRHAELSAVSRELFPELCGKLVDFDMHAVSVILRALNDGSPEVQNAVIHHYGIARVREVARARADRLSNPAYRAWGKRLRLPERDPAITFIQGLWMP